MHPILNPLKSLLGDKGFIAGTDADEFTTDVAGKTASCLAVLRPASTQQVAQIVTLCAEHGVAIIPQGGNTNVCGMTLPQANKPTVLINLSRMKQIIEVDTACSTVTAEAGCTIQDVQEAAAVQELELATAKEQIGREQRATVTGSTSDFERRWVKRSMRAEAK